MSVKNIGSEKLISLLKFHFNNCELPGIKAHIEFLPKFRKCYTKITYKEASVGVILLYDKELKLLLIQRAEDNSYHSGQIAFPGGRREKYDTNLLETAFREIKEEINIKKTQLEYITTLSTVYIPKSKYKVIPVVFFCNGNPKIKLNKKEVRIVYFVSISDLFKNKKQVNIKIGNSLKTVPAFVVNNLIIWGATAMIINELLYILSNFKNEN
ncbi:MAG: CoA pyrophosphatase [Bacteroidales bacterium]|nr:CoA pyrophosphatase [Bacteroidales bacterium]